jgi:hypothetical protein
MIRGLSVVTFGAPPLVYDPDSNGTFGQVCFRLHCTELDCQLFSWPWERSLVVSHFRDLCADVHRRRTRLACLPPSLPRARGAAFTS